MASILPASTKGESMKRLAVVFSLLCGVVAAFAPNNAMAVYDPQKGRWLNRDPIQEDAFFDQYIADKTDDEANRLLEEYFKSPYVFSSNNPFNTFDLLGLITVAIPGVGPQREEGGNSSNEAFFKGVKARHKDTQIFSRDEKNEAVKAIQKAREEKNDCDVNIYGYSRGGKAAVELATMLEKKKIDVNLLFTIDPVTVGDSIPPVPSNVNSSFNHYQDGKQYGPTDFPGTPVTGAQNTHYNDGVIRGYDVRHENMPSIVLPVPVPKSELQKAQQPPGSKNPQSPKTERKPKSPRPNVLTDE